MLVTAHGGSFGTGRNTEKYFQTIKDYNVDIIEVDIWERGDLLYISHLPRLFPKLWTLPLSYVFEFVKEHRFKVNCDVKQGGLVKPVTELARSYGVEDLILFTGSVKPFEIKDVTNEVWLNRSFFGMPPVCENVGKMKARIESYGKSNIKGINFNHKYLSDEFLKRCTEADLAVSAFTVDDEKEQERLLSYPIIANLTSNMPDVTLKLLNKEIKRKKVKK